MLLEFVAVEMSTLIMPVTTVYVILVAWAKFGLRAGDINFRTQ